MSRLRIRLSQPNFAEVRVGAELGNKKTHSIKYSVSSNRPAAKQIDVEILFYFADLLSCLQDFLAYQIVPTNPTHPIPIWLMQYLNIPYG